jgi:hypothetical protein
MALRQNSFQAQGVTNSVAYNKTSKYRIIAIRKFSNRIIDGQMYHEKQVAKN